MNISIIAALSENFVIGDNNQLIWHLPNDLRHFKQLTNGKTIIVGRKTYESIGKALAKRQNIIVTRNKDFTAPNCEISHSLNEALTIANNIDEIMIIGGAQIYEQALSIATKMYLTIVHQHFEGDTRFPQWDTQQWQQIECIRHAADEKNAYDYSFLTYERQLA